MVEEEGKHPEHGGPFENRLRKNVRRFRKWAKAKGLGAYRVYDRDIPEFPYAVDVYGERVQLTEYPRRKSLKGGTLEQERAEALAAVSAALEVPDAHVSVKTHVPQPWGRSQYGRTGEGGERFVVEEQGLKFWVNLGDYLDTGLFMDHRVTRARVRDEARTKRFLNLFCYTGAFTVYAAAGGAASTVSVDLSNTYLDWAEDNLALNGLNGPQHRLVRADVRAWLEAQAALPDRYDLVVMDPPSFSTSKRMHGTLDVQRDHVRLIKDVRALLAPGGVLYFSTNFLGFQLDGRAFRDFEQAQELTPGSIPEDFHFKQIHRCWRAVAPKGGARP